MPSFHACPDTNATQVGIDMSSLFMAALTCAMGHSDDKARTWLSPYAACSHDAASVTPGDP